MHTSSLGYSDRLVLAVYILVIDVDKLLLMSIYVVEELYKKFVITYK